MSKDLSKQLCELCGIEYEKHEPVVEIDSSISKYQIKTLDFIKPENFVRLLKIANDVLGGVHFATAYTKNKPHIFEEQALIHYLPIAKLNNAFHRAIREAEWVYED